MGEYQLSSNMGVCWPTHILLYPSYSTVYQIWLMTYEKKYVWACVFVLYRRLMRNDDECPGNPPICDHSMVPSYVLPSFQHDGWSDETNMWWRILAKISKEANCGKKTTNANPRRELNLLSAALDNKYLQVPIV